MPGFVHVIDDDASFLKATERRLKHAGYEVATYASAQHLLDDPPRESVPSCILLDVRIPGLSGPELQSRLNDALGSTSIVVTHDVQEALDIVDYVYYLSEGVMVAHGTPEQIRASQDPLVHQFVWGEAEGPVAYQYPSKKFSEELELV